MHGTHSEGENEKMRMRINGRMERRMVRGKKAPVATPVTPIHHKTKFKLDDDGDLIFTMSTGTGGEPFVLAMNTQAGLVLLDAMNVALDADRFKAVGDSDLCEEMFDALNAAIVSSR